jgi:hypothetical protein
LARFSENCGNTANGWWSLTGAGSTLNSQTKTSPANTSTASEISFGTSTNSNTYVYVGTSAITYTGSIYLRLVSGNPAINIRVYNSTTGTTLTPITVTSTWARYSVSFTGGASFVEFGVQSPHATTVVVDVWGAQVEVGSGASSYIPTGASGVTRNFDLLLSASSIGASRTAEFSLNDLAPGTSALDAHTVLFVYARDPNNKREYPATVFARTNANNTRVDLRDFSGNTAQSATETRTVQTVTVGTASKVKIALAQSTSAYPISAINGTSATLTSGVIDSALGLQWVQLGNSSMVAGSFNPIWAQQLKLYPTQLTAAQLQTLTTP